MSKSGICARFMRGAAIAAALMASLCSFQAHADTCDWSATKLEIDNVLAGDARKAAEFRRLVSLGKDSLDMLLTLVPEPARKAIDDCAYQTIEYLTDKGFPLLH